MRFEDHDDEEVATGTDGPKYLNVTPEAFGLGLFDPTPDDIARAIAIGRARARRISRVRRSREDVNEFAEYAIRNRETGEHIEQADVHREMQAAMADPEHPYTLIEISRDHGKTTQGLIRTLHELGKNPDKISKIVCEADGPAIKRLTWIKEQIEKNDAVRDVFPHLRPGDNWSKTQITVPRSDPGIEPSIEACGVTTGATGGRLDEALFDDPVGRRNALTVPALRATVKQAINGDWLQNMEPHSTANVLCTGWTTADWIWEAKHSPAWHVLRRPTVGFKSPWSEKWSPAALRKKKELVGPREYERGFLLIPLSGEIVVVNPDWIQYWQTRPDVSRLVLFDAYDLAIGQTKKADYFAGVTIGLDPTPPGWFYVLRGRHHRLSFMGQADMIFNNFTAIRPDFLGIEGTQYQAALPQLLSATTPIANLSNLCVVKPRVSKGLRLSPISGVIEQGRVLFNPSLRPESIRDHEETGCLIDELTQFPLAAHDDLVDAFVYAMTMALEYLLNLAAEQAAQQQADGSGGGITVTVGGASDLEDHGQNRWS